MKGMPHELPTPWSYITVLFHPWVGLGVVLVGLELGFLLAYRANWNLSYAALVANIIVALVFIPIGLLVFKEKVTLTNILGVFVCVAGLVMINLK